jgi:hypothetical protein
MSERQEQIVLRGINERMVLLTHGTARLPVRIDGRFETLNTLNALLSAEHLLAKESISLSKSYLNYSHVYQ